MEFVLGFIAWLAEGAITALALYGLARRLGSSSQGTLAAAAFVPGGPWGALAWLAFPGDRRMLLLGLLGSPLGVGVALFTPLMIFAFLTSNFSLWVIGGIGIIFATVLIAHLVRCWLVAQLADRLGASRPLWVTLSLVSPYPMWWAGIPLLLLAWRSGAFDRYAVHTRANELRAR